jgi:glycosyltransferase involved in cell wall biosynthesis
MSRTAARVLYVHFNTAGSWLFGKYAFTLMNAGAEVEIACLDQPRDRLVTGSYDQLVPTKVFGFTPTLTARSKWLRECQRARHRFERIRSLQRLRRYLLASHPTHVIAGDTPALGLCAPAALRCGASLIYTPFEFYPKVAGTNVRQTTKYERHEQNHIEEASAIVFLGQSILEYYRQKYPSLAAKSHVIYSSWPAAADGGDLRLRREAKIGAGKKIILYQGIIEEDRGLLNVVRALKALPSDTLLVVVGYGSASGILERCAVELGVRDRLFILPPVPQAALMSYTKDADIGIIPLLDAKSHRYACPGKLFEYIAAELALVVSDMPDLRRIVEHYRIGEVYPSQSVEQLTKALCNLVENTDYRQTCSANARQAHAEDLCWEKQSAKFCGIVLNSHQSVCAP